MQLCPSCSRDNESHLNHCVHCGTTLKQLLGRGALLSQGRYRIESVLGSGGYGTVYLATDTHTNQQVAIKENRWHQHHNQFMDEARILQGLSHANLPKVHDVFEERTTLGDRAYFVMDYIPGQTLHEQVRQNGAMNAETALTLLTGVFDAVIYLHSHTPQIIHRDIKPANIKITPDGKAFLVDFGIAKIVDPAQPGKGTTTVKHATTDGFSPIEQYTHTGTDERSDEYALAATLYFALTGRLPPDAIKRGELEHKKQLTLPSIAALNTSVSASVEVAITNGMAVRKEARYPSVAAFVEALRSPTHVPAPTLAPPPRVTPPAAPAARIMPRWAWGGLVVLFVMMLFVGWALRSHQPARTEASRRHQPARTGASPSQPVANPKRGDTLTNPVDGAVMVYIPAGEFIMGSDKSKDPGAGDHELPQRKVYLDGYWIYKCEVTVAQYRKFCKATGRQMPEAPSWGWQDDHPIVSVSWHDAKAYCDWAGVRLPTEAEWEKAARGTDGRIYPWGNDWEPQKCNAFGSQDGFEYTAPVGSFPQGASPYGVLDMAGNVWEWCADWYDANYYRNAPNQNPTGPGFWRLARVLRGGSWDLDNPYYFRAAYRYRCVPVVRLDIRGFRCASSRVPQSR